VHRMLTLASTHEIRTLDAPVQWTNAEQDLQAAWQATMTEFEQEMSHCYFHRAYMVLWKFIAATNAYFHAQEPWKLVKQDRTSFERVLSAVSHSLYRIALFAWPMMPRKMETLLKAFGREWKPGFDYVSDARAATWNATFILTPIDPLFLKIQPPMITRKKEDIMENQQTTETAPISIEDLKKVHLVVGTIVNVDLVPKSEKLYYLTVDLGSHGIRKICAGVRKSLTPEQLLNEQGVFVVNLQPRMMMGVESQGMMLCVQDAQGNLAMVTVATAVPNGTRLS
jgi:methionyl-tRNA synthetase